MSFIKYNKIKEEVSNLLNQVITKEYSIEFDSYTQLNAPPKPGMGEYAFACFGITKLIKKAPNLVSKELEELISSQIQDKKEILKVQAFGPYLNIFLDFNSLTESSLKSILSNKYFEVKMTEGAPKTMIELSQPNTHKEMHVGHMRNLCLGSSLVNIHKYCNYPTISTTFPGDVGTHVAKCLWYYKFHNKTEIPQENKGAWLGTLYTKGNNLLEEQKGTDHEANNRTELTSILKQLEEKNGEYYDLWKETRKWSIELMEKAYKWADVQFDVWYWESDVDSSSVELVKKYQKEGLFIVDDGAVGIDLSDDKLGFCLLLKSDGTGLYATKDIELARRKFEDYNIEKNIYVVDNRQARHFKQVFKTLEKMGFENAQICYHLQYEMVELPDGAMSSRKGNVVALWDLINQMQEKIKEDYLNKYKDEWSPEEIESTAQIIASGAIKYGMTKIDSNKKIVFDMNEWLKLDGESGPYIQYVCARINSILVKKELEIESADFTKLNSALEGEIVKKLIDFNETVENALSNYKTHLITSYIYDLAKLFNSYYAENKIISEDVGLTHARLCLAKSIRTTLSKGLELLGIKTPTRM